MPHFLSIDFETRSVLDLRKTGAFRYAEHPSTEVLCASYAFDDGPVLRWRKGEPCPMAIREHVAGGGKIRAWNAQFEAALWVNAVYHQGWLPVEPEQFLCSASLAARCALPRSLEEAARALGLPVRKDAEGHRLMLQMCKPRSIAPDGTVTWWEDEARMGRLMQYCDTDVIVEREVFKHLPAVGSETERAVWLLDQEINRRGIGLDRAFVERMSDMTSRATGVLDAEMATATRGQVSKVTQVGRLTAWVLGETRSGLESLDKEHIRDLLKTEGLSTPVREALEIRQEGSKSSTAKLVSMQRCVCDDGRVRGLLRYFGASTGRWAGQLVQPQNFPRGTVLKVERYLPLIQAGEYDLLEMAAGEPVMDILASSLRGCFVSGEGKEFIAADFNAIEARVLAWLAGAKDMLAEFAKPAPALYAEMGAAIFGVSAEQVQAGHESGDWPLGRWLGKTTVLGAGFQMGWEKFLTQARKLGEVDLGEDVARRAIDTYRSLHYQVPALWRGMQAAAVDVVEHNVTAWTEVAGSNGLLHFAMDGGWLRMGLPSGRSLWYYGAEIRERELPWSTLEAPAFAPAVTYMGVNSITRKWQRQVLYGGLLTENACQAVARDLMAEAMLRVESAGYPVVLTVHDEVVSEIPRGFGSVEGYCELMAQVPEWAAGCPIAAEGWRGERYRK